MELLSRDGKPIRELGSWEKEQIAKETKYTNLEVFSKKKRLKKVRIPKINRKPATIEKNPLLYITFLKKGNPKYKVYFRIGDSVKPVVKSFIIKDYDTEQEALNAAILFRDELIQKYRS